MNQIRARLLANAEIMPGVFLMWLEAPGIAAGATPGQFVMVRCGGDTVLPRPISIHQRQGEKIALLVRIAGKGTGLLVEARPGDAIEIFGPLGNGFSVVPDSKNLLLVAGGIGIAPLYFLAQDAAARGCKVTLLYGTANKDRYPVSGIDTVDITDDGSCGREGLLTEIIPEYTDKADQIFACGPMVLYRAMSEMTELQDKPVQASLEIMMGCGRGVCYGCTIRTKKGLRKVCEHGPVFELADVLWDKFN